MAGQLCWLPEAERDGERVLHLRIEPNQPWCPYTAVPSVQAQKSFLMPQYKSA